MVVLTLSGDRSQLSLINPNVPQRLQLTWTGTYVATVAETTVDIFEVSPYRSITVATRASGGGAASVVIKIYACDSTGAVPSGAAPLLTKTLATWTTTTYTLDVIQENWGAVTAATWPTGATGGRVLEPFGNYIKITETPTYTSGTATLALELALKG